MKKKKNRFERLFDSLYRCLFKVFATVVITVILCVGVIGSEVSYNFRLSRVEKVVKDSLIGKIVKGFDFIKEIF